MRRIALLAVALLGGCQAILGIEDTQTADDDTTVDAAVPGIDAPVDTPDAAPGTPDADLATFALGALPLKFDVPLDGAHELAVSVTRTGGFDGTVTIGVDPITGLTAPDVVLGAGETTGLLRMSLDSSSGLALGDTFNFTVVATSGALMDSGMVEGEVVGAPGTLEPTFGTAGVVNDIRGAGSSDDTPMRRVAEMSDGDIIAVGTDTGGLGAQQIVTVRLTAAGARDTTFSGDGMDLEPIADGFGAARGFDLAQHDVSKILVIGDIVAGNPDDDVVLMQYQANGNHDILFGSPFDHNLGGDEGGHSLALAADDTFAVGGTKDGAAMIVRYNAGSGLINSFGTNGVLTLPGTDVVALHFVAGRIVAVISSSGSTIVARVMLDGTVEGMLTIPGLSPRDAAFADDGVTYVAGVCGAPCVAKVLPTGALDATYGTAGIATHDFSGAPEQLTATEILADGKLVIAGNVQGDPWLLRLREDGTIDDTFDSLGPTDGRGGGVVVPALGVNGSILDVTQAENGDLLLCGTGISGTAASGLVARLRN